MMRNINDLAALYSTLTKDQKTSLLAFGIIDIPVNKNIVARISPMYNLYKYTIPIRLENYCSQPGSTTNICISMLARKLAIEAGYFFENANLLSIFNGDEVPSCWKQFENYDAGEFFREKYHKFYGAL